MTQDASGAVSLKVLAERKIDGVQKTTQFKVHPKILEFEEGFNARPIDREHVASLKASFMAGVGWGTIEVRVDDGRVNRGDFHISGAHEAQCDRDTQGRIVGKRTGARSQ